MVAARRVSLMRIDCHREWAGSVMEAVASSLKGVLVGLCFLTRVDRAWDSLTRG